MTTVAGPEAVAEFLGLLTIHGVVGDPEEPITQPERRAANRYAAQLAVCVQKLDITLRPVGPQQDFEMRTISRDGLSFVTDHPIELGTHLYMTVVACNNSIDMIAFVRQCTPCGELFGIGVEFIFDEFDSLVSAEHIEKMEIGSNDDGDSDSHCDSKPTVFTARTR